MKDIRERTLDFGLRMIRMFGALPKSTEAQVIGKQVLRSGTSIGANYCEALRARSKSEYVAKLNLCLMELEETAFTGWNFWRERRSSRLHDFPACDKK